MNAIAAAIARRPWLRRLLGWPGRVAVIVAVAALVAWRVDWSTAHAAFSLHSWGKLTLAVSANFVSVVMTGVAWKGVVDGLPAIRRPTRLIDLVSPLMVGFLFNTVLAARVGELVKVFLLRRRLAKGGQPVLLSSLVGSVVAANLFATIAWVVTVASIGTVLGLPRYVWVTTMLIGAACLGVVLVAMLQRPIREPATPNRHARPWTRAASAAGRLWMAVRESHLALRNPRQTALVVAGSVGTWLFQLAGIYFTLNAFGLGGVGWRGAGLLLVTVTLAQLFPVLPGNLVIFQAAAVVPLTATFHVGAADAIAFSIVLQFSEAAVGIALGFCFLLAEGIGFSELRREATDTGDHH
ncbi:MAG: flippase-like domain-containing protein [Actinobacteria bacterium]|nr:flippase-like domain-containing protein [Actinomycetota bacterium]